MTITTAPAPLSFDGDDSTTGFAITWKYFAKSEVVVNLRSSANVETLQVIDTHYTLTAAGVDSGGTLTMVTAPATGETLVIDLVPPNTQTAALPRGGPFPSTAIEDELDKIAQRTARLEALFDRVMLVPKTDKRTGSDLELPIDTAREGFQAYDSDGKPIIAAGTSANLKAVSTFVDTLLDDADAVTFRQTTLLDKSGADIASAATIDLDASTGDFVDVTGTVTITAITLGDGVEKTVRFTGSLTLTHGASLVLEGSANIQTAAGDIAVFRGDASSVVRLKQYYRLQSHGSDVASATTTDLDAATGDLIDVTGTTTITGITLAEGREATVRFTGALTLTNGASLVLPGAANITTVAGDFAIFRGYASSVVRCVSYVPTTLPPSRPVSETVIATTSGTTHDFTSLPSWIQEIIISFFGVSLSGTDSILVQIGDAGGFETTGYISSSNQTDSVAGSGGDEVLNANDTTAFVIRGGGGADAFSGHMVLTLIDPATDDWVSSHSGKRNTTVVTQGGGDKSLSATLTQVRITRSGTDTFDAGKVNIIYK